MGIRKRIRQTFAIVVACAGIGGCAPLAEVVKRNADAAAEIDQRCGFIGNAMVLPQNATDEDIRDEVAARLRLRFTGTTYKLFCNPANGSSGTCKPEDLSVTPPDSKVSIFPVRPIDARLEELREKLKLENEPEADAAKNNLRAIRQQIVSIHGAINALRDKLEVSNACEKRRECATEVLDRATELVEVLTGKTGNTGNKGALEAISEELLAFERNIRLLDQKAQALGASINQEVLTELLRLVDEGRRIFAVAQTAFAAFRQKDVLAIADALFGDIARYRAADASLRYLENALAPVDRFVDKVYDKWYLAGSIGLIAFETDVQQQFDQLYHYIWNKQLRYWDLQLAFARASCARLSASPPPNSTVMPFVYRMLVNGLPRMACGKRPDLVDTKDLAGMTCVADGKPITASTEKVALEVFKTLTIANKTKPESTKAGNSQDQGSKADLTPSPHASAAASTPKSRYSQFNRFEICYQAELIARAQGLQAGQGEIGNVAGYSCGDYIYRQLETPGAVSQQKQAALQSFSGTNGSGRGDNTIKELRAELEASTRRTIAELHGGEVERTGALSPVQTPVPLVDHFCARFEARAEGVRCYPDLVGGYALELDDAFPRGDWKSVVLEAKLERIGEFLRHQTQRFEAVVRAAASQAPVSCAAVFRSVAPIADKMTWRNVTPKGDANGATTLWMAGAGTSLRKMAAQVCSGPSDDGNRLLAMARANWAADVVARRAGAALEVKGVAGERAGYPYDTPSDRKLTMRLKIVPSASQRVIYPAGAAVSLP